VSQHPSSGVLKTVTAATGSGHNIGTATSPPTWPDQATLGGRVIRMHTDTTPPQPNHNVTPTHIEPEQYNP